MLSLQIGQQLKALALHYHLVERQMYPNGFLQFSDLFEVVQDDGVDELIFVIQLNKNGSKIDIQNPIFLVKREWFEVVNKSI